MFDVLGRLFEARPLRDLLVEAVRYGDDPEIKARLFRAVDGAVDQENLRELLDERALATDTMDASRVRRIREDLERANASRLQPFYIQALFVKAFRRLGGQLHRREPDRFEISHVPAVVRARDRQTGTRDAVLPRYERVCFDKDRIAGSPPAAFVCPGHPLLDAVIDLVREQDGPLLRQGAVLVASEGDGPARLLLCLRQAIHDGRVLADGANRIVSERMQFVELFETGEARHAGPAPHLDYRPATAEETTLVADVTEARWLSDDLEPRARRFAIGTLVPRHLDEVRAARLARLDKVEAEVKRRLKQEIHHWDHRANELRERELAGKPARLSAEMARRRADALEERLRARLAEVEREREIAALPPTLVGAALVVPEGMLRRLCGQGAPPDGSAEQRAEIERLAMEAVMRAERGLGYQPEDVSQRNVGYDIESRDPAGGPLRFIEVKGRAAGADTVTVTRNEILTALNAEDRFVLALVEVGGGSAREPRYVRRPFQREPDIGAASVVYRLGELLARAAAPG